MTFKARVKRTLDRLGQPLAHFANSLAAISFLGSAAAWFATNQHWLWPFAASAAICACLILAAVLHQTRAHLIEVNQAFDHLVRRESERIVADWQAYANRPPEHIPITEMVSAIEMLRPHIAPKKIESLLRSMAQIEQFQRK